MPRPDDLVADRYRLVTLIASGGMGSVWEAWDERLHRRVALKQLHPQPGLSPADAQLASDRAMREARITARLHHPHAVPVYDVVDHDGLPCLVMQYLPSKSLQTLISERGVLTGPEVARIGGQVADALAAAHQVGIVHRDVKPGNVLIDEDGAAKLTDFGISHALGDASLTSTGMVTGTPAFLAPEVARGVDSTAASDVFSLGSTLYAALEGVPPFGTGENPMATLHRVASGRIAPPRRSGPLTPVLERMLAFDPATRPSMAEVAGILSAAAVDPAAATHRMAAPPPRTPYPPRPASGPPPARTVMLPAAHPGPPVRVAPEPPAPRRRLGIALAAAVIVLVLAAGVAFLVHRSAGSGDPGTTAAAGPTTAAGPTPVHHSSTVRSTSAASSPRTPSPPPTATEPPADTSPPTHASKPGKDDKPSAAQRVQAVSDYYALLPGNTDAAWDRLTSRYQSEHANGRSDYDDFWASVAAVSVDGAKATGKDAVEAVITYRYKGGRVVDERTRFRLVASDGGLKIDGTTVLGSKTR